MRDVNMDCRVKAGNDRANYRVPGTGALHSICLMCASSITFFHLATSVLI